MERRSYLLKMAGTTGLIAVAGCLGDGDDTEDDTEEEPTDGLGIDTGQTDHRTDDTEETADDTEDTFDGTTGPSQGWPQPGSEPRGSRRLSVGLHGTYRIEDGERHYFNVQLQERDHLTVTMYYTHDDGDLNLEVLNPDEEVVGSSTSDADDESVTIQAAESDAYRGRESYYVVPSGSPGVTNQYDVEIEID